MFCSKCGSKIADDAKFCSVCGARAVSTGLESATEHSVNKTQYSSERNTTPKPSRGFSLDLDWDDVEEQPSKKSGNLDFDWSSVIEERKPKKTTGKKIRSPWEDSSDSYEMNPGMPSASSYRTPKRKTSLEEELFGKEAPSRERSRTMNFIDVLKEEKDQQAREEYEKLRSESPRRSSILSTAHPAGRASVLPEEQREHTQGYTDLKDDIFAGLENDEPKELSFEDQLANIRAERKEAQRKAESRRVEPIEDRSSSEDAFEEMLRGMKHGFNEEPAKAASPRRTEPRVEEDRFRDNMPSGDFSRGRNTMFREYQDSFESIDDYDDVQLKNLEDDVNSSDSLVGEVQEEPSFFFGEDKEPILNTKELDDESELDVTDVDLFGEVPTSDTVTDQAENSVEDEYAAFDEYLDYMTPRRSSRTSRAARAQAEEAFDDEDDDLYDSFDAAMEAEDKAQKESKATSIAAEAPVEPVVTETSAATAETSAESKAAVDDEIAALQKQLEMLMKQKAGAPVTEAAAEAETTPTVEETSAEAAPESVTVPTQEGHEEVAAPEFAEDNLEVAQDPTENLVDEEVAETVASAKTEFDEPAAATTPESKETADDEIVSDDTFASDDQLDLDKELAQLGFYLGETSSQPEEPLFNAESMDVGGNGTDTVVLSPEDLSKGTSDDEDFMSLEKMESDIFGNSLGEDDPEATRKIDKFYTLYRKNEEFQKLLDEEYNKLQGGDIEDDVQDSIDAILGRSETPASAESIVSPQQEQQEASAENVQPTLSQTQAPAVNDESLATAATEAAVKDSRKKVKKKKAESEEYSGKGGSVLTVIAIVVAALLVFLLAIILILNFAPESGIAQSLNEIIGNYTNFFADAGSDSLL